MGFFIYTKIMYKCDDDFWDKIRAYKRERGFKTLNAAMTELLAAGLDHHQKSVVPLNYKQS